MAASYYHDNLRNACVAEKLIHLFATQDNGKYAKSKSKTLEQINPAESETMTPENLNHEKQRI